MESIPGPEPVRNKTIYPFNLRVEYTLLPEEFEGKAPRGPNSVDKFTFRDIDYCDRVEDWTPPYWEDLRELALHYWIGTEFDIALMRRELNPASSVAFTKIYHVFDKRSDKMVRLVTGGEWKMVESHHYIDKKVNYIQVISYLLTYYNAVFFDDTVDKVSRVYFQNPLSKPPGNEIKISREVGTKDVYLKEDFWSAELDFFYSKSSKP